MSLEDIRRDYASRTLERDDLLADPFEQFKSWFDETLNDGLGTDPTAMVVATCADNVPTQRVVLLKRLDTEGFVFYTNYNSQKGQQLAVNPNCSLHFAWLPQERQIHIQGVAQRLTDEQNLRYFQSRPRASQIAAWASEQSSAVADRASLDAQYQAIEARFANDEKLPLPPTWGGFLVVPRVFEFWQGRRARLHDRFRYTLDNASWQLQRLQP
ncbi:pyridoxamine 5'-phosphate oxidase [Aliidiomarina haloalkalitolerans]|uniref:Pyridoxine/pyridoxamine 5'-phosphate oxidase n=1 Tax=Aliidiomarina haloalkalitolerans TaxID=859059 RepID=A0A432VU20_9GAMM|nr:pyridoxamine 5'-phosphate oxidase [Aliidiomarina haloalkalitolerans]RUO19909.1 pyridoxamine 5'-phosphate oxidase [Aliidiomarina haloalkalitolerans]